MLMSDVLFIDGHGFCGYQTFLLEFIFKIEETLDLVNKT